MRKSDRKIIMSEYKMKNNIIERLHKLLRSTSALEPRGLKDNQPSERSEEMTTREAYELLIWAKEKGYTLDEIIALFKRIANVPKKE